MIKPLQGPAGVFRAATNRRLGGVAEDGVIVPAGTGGEQEHHRHAPVFAVLASDSDKKLATPITLVDPSLDLVVQLVHCILEPTAVGDAYQDAPVLSGAPIAPFYGCGNI